jgi:6-phosphogluconolactonase
MEFRNFGRIALAAAVSLGLALGMTACGPGNTFDFLYVVNSKANPGQINVYAVDSQSGALIQPKYSPYPSGGRNPVAIVTTPNGKQLFVANHDDNTVVNFGIGTDGKLYPLQTCNTPGSFPTFMAVNPAGTFLFVVETYQPNFSTSIPGPGAIVVFPIASDGTVSCTSPVANGTLAYFPVGTNPLGVNVLPTGNFVYVVNASPTPAATGTTATPAGITAFQLASSGVLTQVGEFPVGVEPNAVSTDPTSRFLYVADGASNQLDGFLVQTNGSLLGMQAPFAAGNLPDSVVIDPRGEYVYAANYNSSTVSAYAISQGNGQLSAISGAATGYAVDTGPTCVLIEPALGRYLYTTNFLGNTVTGLFLNPNTGALSTVQNSPFAASGQPTCGAAIPHGNHAVQAVQP